MTMLTEQAASRVIASLDETCPCFPGTCRGDAVNGRLANGQRCKAAIPVPIKGHGEVLDRVPRGMKADDAEKLISECAEQAGVDTGDFKPLGWNILHRVANAAHKAGFIEALKRVGLGVKD